MTSSFYVMWSPFFIFVVFYEMVTGKTMGPTAEFITCWLGGANSFVNPLIYIPTLRSYRRELRRVLTATKSCLKRKNSSIMETTGSFSERSSIKLFQSNTIKLKIYKSDL